MDKINCFKKISYNIVAITNVYYFHFCYSVSFIGLFGEFNLDPPNTSSFPVFNFAERVRIL